MKKRYVFTTINLVMTLFLILLFCGNPTAYSQAAEKKVPVSCLGCPQGPPTAGLIPQYGGTLTMIYQYSPANLGAPWKVQSPHDGALNRFAVENLVGLNAEGAPIPQLATSWDIDLNKKTVTFTLRKGVKFHDGTDFNAQAVKWCLEMYKKGPKPDLRAVTAIDVIDDYHLRLALSAYDPLFVQSLNTSGCGDIISPAAAQKLGDDIMVNPVGTGPFKFVSFKPNVSLIYTKFDGYWQKGLPYLDGVEVKIVRDPVVSLASFTKGEAQAVNGIPTRDAADLKKQGNTIDANTVTILGIGWDSKNPGSPFRDIRVRRAIAHAIDTDAAVKSAFDNMFPATNQLATKGVQGYDPSIKGYSYNPDKARALLAEVGISPKKPLKTTLTYAADPQRTDLYTLVQAYLSAVGIDVALKPIPFPAYAKTRSKGWEGLIMYGLSYNGLEMQYSATYERNLSTRAATFTKVWVPDKMMALLDKAKAEMDWDKREGYYRELNKMAIDEYCLVIPMFGLDKFTVKSPGLVDFGLGNRTVGAWLPERAWLKK